MNKNFNFILLVALAILFSIEISAQENASLNYVWNESCTAGDCWVPWLATAEGKPHVDLNLINITAENASLADSLIANYIFPYSLASTILDNITINKDVHILGTLYGSSPLRIENGIDLGGTFNLTGNITSNDGTILLSNDNTGNLTIENSLLTDYIYSRTNPVTSINNLTIANDIFSSFNITAADSVNTDYLFPKSASFTRIDNVTIAQDLRVLGSSYLSSFTIGNDLLVGSNNISSTFTGLGTLSPEYLLHLNISNNDNESVSPLLLLEKTNLSTGSGDSYGAGIIFRLMDDAGEVENVSQIAGILEDVSNGTERGALVFYTGYGDINGIISNLSSAETLRLTAEGNASLTGSLAVKDSLEVTNNLTAIDSILTDYIYNQSGPSINLMEGFVGIGTTAPGANLQIHTAVGSNPRIYLSDGDVAHGITGVVPTDILGRIIALSDTSGGLRVEGFSDDASQTGIYVIGTIGNNDPTDTTSAIELAARKKDVAGTSTEAIGNAETVLQVTNNGAALMTLLGSGNVGIGETSPGAPLHFSKASGRIIQWNGTTTATNAGSIGFLDSTSGTFTTIGANQFFDGTNNLRFDTSKPGMYIQIDARNDVNKTFFRYINDAGTESDTMTLVGDTGNVGIGTTNISGNWASGHTILNVMSPSGANRAGVLILESGQQTTTGLIGEIDFSHAGSTNAGIAVVNDGASDSGDLYFVTKPTGSAITERMRIQSDGNVGIGTTAPAWPSQSPVLHIKSGASALPAFVLESGHSTYPGNWTFRVAASGASDANLVITNGASNDRLTIDNSGNVGIGTTAPQGQGFGSTRILHITNDHITQGGQIVIGGTGASNTQNYSLVSNNNTFSITRSGASIDAFNIDSSDNVGIGTTSPDLINGNSETGTQLNVNDSDGIAMITIEGATNARLFMVDGNSAANTKTWLIEPAAGALDFQRLNDAGSLAALEMRINSSGVSAQDTFFNSNLDYAEWHNSVYEYEKSAGVKKERIEQGDILALTEGGKNWNDWEQDNFTGKPSPGLVKKASLNDIWILGVASKESSEEGGTAAFIGGSGDVLVAYLGRVPVKVKGPVKFGDYIWISDEPGIGQAVNYKTTIRALETNSKKETKKVMAAVKINI